MALFRFFYGMLCLVMLASLGVLGSFFLAQAPAHAAPELASVQEQAATTTTADSEFRHPLSVHMDYVRGADTTLVLLATITLDPGYYTYAYNAGTGRPTRIELRAAGGGVLPALVRYPVAKPHIDVFSGKEVPAYTGAFPVFVRLGQTELNSEQLEISLLLCSAAHCIPYDARLPLPPLPEQISALDASPWLTAWNASLPVETGLAGSSVTVPKVADAAPPTDRVQPLPQIGFRSLLSSPPPSSSSSSPSLPLSPSGPSSSSLPSPSSLEPPVLSSTQPAQMAGADRTGWAFSPVSDDANEPVALGAALFWGLLAGLILNVMPCVLPVMTLKLSTLLGAAATTADLTNQADSGRMRRFREHNLFFAAGILTWFAVLAGAVSGLDMSWGGLFQHAWAVSGLAVLIGVLGLSMLGLCTLPVIDLKAGISGSPRSQAYATGLTATLLATPCSGPLLGGVLAWSALQPPLIVLLVFLSTGLGMATPYLLFAAWPRTVRLLPRPGAWLGWLERGVGCLLLGTCTYLLTLLPVNTAMWLAVALAVVACVCVWRQGKLWRVKTLSLFRQWALVLACLGLVVWLLAPADSTHSTEQAQAQLWEAFTPARFRAALGNEPILLEFTADWCPNCKLLEATSLSPDRLRAWKAAYGLRLMRVDMTAHDPKQEALLRALGSISIPLTAIFPVGVEAHSPRVLRDIYTPERLDRALEARLR